MDNLFNNQQAKGMAPLKLFLTLSLMLSFAFWCTLLNSLLHSPPALTLSLMLFHPTLSFPLTLGLSLALSIVLS